MEHVEDTFSLLLGGRQGDWNPYGQGWPSVLPPSCQENRATAFAKPRLRVLGCNRGLGHGRGLPVSHLFTHFLFPSFPLISCPSSSFTHLFIHSVTPFCLLLWELRMLKGLVSGDSSGEITTARG